MLRGFESYAREDEDLSKQLGRHLTSLRTLLEVWNDRRVQGGEDREQQLTAWQEQARIQLLLISADSFHSEECQRQMRRALALQEEGRARVIPILVRSVDVQDSAIAGLQMLPRNGVPVTRWSLRDDAWLDVVQGIRSVLEAEAAAPSRQAPAEPVRSLVEGLPQRVGRDVSRFLGYYLGSGGSEGPIFGGRDAELGELDRWLDTPGAPQCLLITGPGGRGKSALLAHWVRRVSAREGLDVAFFPISVRFGTNRTGLLHHALAARLSRLHGKPPPSEQDTAVELLRDVASELLFPVKGRRLLVVIDALDEAADLELDTSFFPIPLPEGVRVVLSARPRPGDRIPWLHQLGWDQGRLARQMELRRLDVQGVADALGQLSPALEPVRRHPGFADALFRLSEGDPLVLWIYLKWLQDHPEVRDPSQLPTEEPGLDSYFQGWWEAQIRLWGPRAPAEEPRVRRLLSLLASALGPLTRGELLHLMGEESGLTFDTKLEALSRLIIGDGKNGYAFTHPGLGDYFQGKLSKAERKTYEGEFLSWGAQTVQALQSGELKPEEVPSYLVRYYAAHLERSGAEPEALLQLVSDPWHRASETREKTNAVFLDDVMRASRAVRRRNQARVKAGAVPFLSDELRCLAVRTSLHSLARNFTPFLLSALVENGLWSLEVALAHARHEPKKETRCLGLIGLARLSSEPSRSEILEEVIDTVLSAENPYLLSKMARELVPQLSPELVARAVARIDAFQSLHDSANNLALLAFHAPELAQRTLVPRALELALQLSGPAQKSVLGELGPELIEAYRGDATVPPAYVKLAANPLSARDILSIASDEDRPRLGDLRLKGFWRWHVAAEVPELPAVLPRATLQELLSRGRATYSEMGYATLLEILAPRLEGALLEEAVNAARRLGTPPIRSKVLTVLSSRFPEPRRRELLHEALEASRSLADVRGGAKEMVVLASSLSGSRKDGVLRAVLNVIQSAPPSRGRLVNLASLVRALPQPEREAVFDTVLREAESSASPSTWVDILRGLGPAAGEPRLWSALERLSPLPPVTREKILEVAAPYLPEHWLEGALEFTLQDAAVWAGILPDARHTVLEAIAPRLPEGLQARAVERLLPTAPGVAVDFIELLGPHLAERWMGPLVEMSRTLRDQDGVQNRVAAMSLLLPRLPEAERPAVLEEVFQLMSWEIPHGFEYKYSRAVKALAPHLTETQLSRSVEAVLRLRPYDRTKNLCLLAPFSSKAVEALRQHALLDARAEEREQFRSALLGLMGPWLTRPQVLEALELAKQIERPNDRISALMGLLPALPAPAWEGAIELALRDAPRSDSPLKRLAEAAPQAARLPPQRLYPLLSELLATSYSSTIRGTFYEALEALAPVLNALAGEEEMVRIIQTLLDVETWWS